MSMKNKIICLLSVIVLTFTFIGCNTDLIEELKKFEVDNIFFSASDLGLDAIDEVTVGNDLVVEVYKETENEKIGVKLVSVGYGTTEIKVNGKDAEGTSLITTITVSVDYTGKITYVILTPDGSKKEIQTSKDEETVDFDKVTYTYDKHTLTSEPPIKSTDSEVAEIVLDSELNITVIGKKEGKSEILLVDENGNFVEIKVEVDKELRMITKFRAGTFTKNKETFDFSQINFEIDDETLIVSENDIVIITTTKDGIILEGKTAGETVIVISKKGPRNTIKTAKIKVKVALDGTMVTEVEPYDPASIFTKQVKEVLKGILNSQMTPITLKSEDTSIIEVATTNNSQDPIHFTSKNPGSTVVYVETEEKPNPTGLLDIGTEIHPAEKYKLNVTVEEDGFVVIEKVTIIKEYPYSTIIYEYSYNSDLSLSNEPAVPVIVSTPVAIGSETFKLPAGSHNTIWKVDDVVVDGTDSSLCFEDPTEEGEKYISFTTYVPSPNSDENSGEIKITNNIKVTTSIKTYSVTLEKNGGVYKSGKPDVQIPKTINYYSAVLPLPTADDFESRMEEGLKFIGWFTKPDFSGKIVTTLENLCGDITLYARWSIVGNATFTISYLPGNMHEIIYDENTKTASIESVEGSTYQWYVDTVKQEGQTSSTFSFAQFTTPGIYEVSVVEITKDNRYYNSRLYLTVEASN